MSTPAVRTPATAPHGVRLANDGPTMPWSWLIGIAVVALLLRIVLYSGFMGSDEVTYVESAYKLLLGDWSVSSYVGANRYGINLPIAAFAAVFGVSEASAAAWGLLCSVAEVLLLAWVGAALFGRRIALVAALLLACLPLHVHNAGRLLADSPLALAITASMLLFLLGERRHDEGQRGDARVAWLLAGLAAGASFWVKPATLFYVAALLAYPLLFWRWRWDWAWIVLGCVLALAANFALFKALTGNWWFLFEAMRERGASGYLQEGLSDGSITDAPGLYLQYLFVKVYHTGLLGPVAAVGVLLLVRQAWRERGGAAARVLWWALGLLALFSIFIVSTKPLVFVPKQSNYMLYFLAPLALAAAWAVVRLPGRWPVVAFVVMAVPALALAALQQISLLTFTANSRALVDYVRQQGPDTQVMAGTNGFRAAIFESLVRPQNGPARVLPLAKALEDADPAQVKRRLAVVDLQTADWGTAEPVRRLNQVPACWKSVAVLEPAPSGWLGRLATSVLKPLGGVPGPLRAHLTPAPAHIFEVPAQACPVPAPPPKP